MAGGVLKQNHIVLVHGICHGAWCWYRVKPLLESAGNRVTVVDLAASGIHRKAIQDVHTMYEYSEPLLDLLASLQPDEKVVLVGHSLGGLNVALATEKFPQKIAVAIYLTAFMPDTAHRPSFVLEQFFEKTPGDTWLDTEFLPYSSTEPHHTTMLFGHKFLSRNAYQLSPIEDLELAKTLIRPGSVFLHDLAKLDNFSEEGYGSVPRVYVVCKEDTGVTLDFQKWMIANSPVERVMEIEGSDHMPMFSKPQELCRWLSDLAHEYA